MRNFLLVTILFFSVSSKIIAQNCSINAGVNASICISDSMVLYGSRSGLINNGSTSKWTQIYGSSVIIVSPNALTSKVVGFGTGIYKFKISIKCKDGLFAEDSVVVTVLPVTQADAGRDTIYCPYQDASMQGNALANGERGRWTLASTNKAGITILSPTSPTSSITFNPSASGTTTLRWTITNANGCSTYDDVVITNSGGAITVDAGPDQILGNCFFNTTCAVLHATNGGTGFGEQIGIWSFVSGPSIPTITPTNSPTTKVCNLKEGIYILRYTVVGPCSNGFDDVSIVVPPSTQDISIANANTFESSNVYCGIANTISLNGNIPLYTNETVLWTQTSGPPVTINNPSSPSTTISGVNTYDKYCFSYSIINTSSNCVSNSTVCYSFYQYGTVDGGPNQELPCNITSTTIPTITTGNGDLNYKIISGPIGVFNYPVDLKNSNVISNLTKPGTYKVEIKYSFGIGCSPISDFVDITVSRTPTNANAGTDQNFACVSTSTQLAGNDPTITGYGSGRWSQISGPNTSELVTPTNYICNVRNTIAGTYFYRWTITGGNKCTDNFDDIKIVIPDSTVTKANAGIDKVICPNSPVTLLGNSVRADETIQWSSIPAGVSFYPSNKVSMPVVNGLAANSNYSFIYMITNSCGSISRDTVGIITNFSVGPSVANAGENQCLPTGTTSINLDATLPSYGTGTWSQISGIPVTIVDSTLNTTSVTGMRNGNYLFVWTVAANGCSLATKDTVLISITNVSTANAGLDITACANNVKLSGNNPTNGIGIWSQVSGDGAATISDVNNPTAIVSNLYTGVYVFKWTISNGACLSNTDDVKLTISSPPSNAIAGDDQILCGELATQTYLNAVLPSIGTGQWVQVSGASTVVFADAMLPNSKVSNFKNGTYTFRWIVSGGPGCPQSTDDVIINVSLPANAGNDQSLCNSTSTILSGNIGSTGIWSQTAGPNTIIFQTPVGNPNATVTGLIPNSNYTFRYTIPAFSGCPATYDEVNIKNGSFALVPDAGTDTSYCNVTAFQLSGSQPGQGETGLWSVLSGPSGAAFFPSAASPIATLKNAVSGTYVLKWTISNAICSSSDQKKIENFAPPTISRAGLDQIVCFERAILKGNIPQNGIGTWSQVDGPKIVTIAAINNPISEVAGLTKVGTYHFVWTISNGPICQPSKDTVSLTVTALSPSIAFAGIDQRYCNQSSIQLNGNIPSVGNGTWSEIGTSSSATIVSLNSATSTIEQLNTGQHSFVWTIANTDKSCISRDTVIITNQVLPNTANAGVDDTFCLFNSVSLQANAAVEGTIGTWSFVSGNNTPVLLSPNNNVCELTGLNVGTYTFKWTIASESCPSSTDDVKITVINNADLAVAGANQTVCAKNINLYANTPTGNNKGIWSQVEGPNNAVIVSTNLSNSTVTNLIPGVYRFVWKIFNARCSTTDTVTYSINTPAEVFAGNDLEVCNNTTTILLSQAIVNSPDGKGFWTIISGAGSLSISNPTTRPNTVYYIPPADYNGELILRLSAQDACHVVTDDISISLIAATVPISATNDFADTYLNTSKPIDVLSNDTVYNANSLNFCLQNSIVENPVHGNVQLNDNGVIEYSPYPNFSGLDSFQYQICTQQDADSSWAEKCFKEGSDSAWVFVNVKSEQCLIPNAFSPNGDGINDMFVINCAITDVEFSVFNNWGMEVYSSKDYKNDWNGNYQNKLMPDGTYFYSLKYKDSSNMIEKRAGFITLHR